MRRQPARAQRGRSAAWARNARDTSDQRRTGGGAASRAASLSRCVHSPTRARGALTHSRADGTNAHTQTRTRTRAATHAHHTLKQQHTEPTHTHTHAAPSEGLARGADTRARAAAGSRFSRRFRRARRLHGAAALAGGRSGVKAAMLVDARPSAHLAGDAECADDQQKRGGAAMPLGHSTRRTSRTRCARYEQSETHGRQRASRAASLSRCVHSPTRARGALTHSRADGTNANTRTPTRKQQHTQSQRLRLSRAAPSSARGADARARAAARSRCSGSFT
jgi:hypothetical protein